MPVVSTKKPAPPPYRHQEYPMHVFHPSAGGSKVVHSKEEHDALAEKGWTESPDEFTDAVQADESGDGGDAALLNEEIDRLVTDNATKDEEIAALKAALAEASAAQPAKAGKKAPKGGE